MADQEQVKIDAAVETVWTQAEALIQDIPGVYDTWELEKTGLGIEDAWKRSKALRSRIEIVVDKVGETFPTLPDSTERRKIIIAFLCKAWKKYGRDIPWVDDDHVIAMLVDAAIAAWRARRRMARA